MEYRIEEIATVLNAELIKRNEHFDRVDWLLIDSRSLAFPDSTLFFALKTKRNDGHKFVGELYAKHVRNFVISQSENTLPSKFKEANFILVDSPLEALQNLAKYHRSRFDIPMIGVTGSNGKTMVKEWLYQLLGHKFKITRSPRSYNSQIGVPLSVWNLNESTEIGIFEAGISMPNEMERLRDIIRPNIGVITNISGTHQENFRSIEEKCSEKLQLFKDCEIIVYNGDDELINDCINKNLLTCKEIAWSTKNRDKPLYIRSIKKEAGRTLIAYRYIGFDAQFELPFTDDASITDSLHCLAVCLYFMFTPTEIADYMKSLESVAMRMEVKEGDNGCVLINDSYNSDLTSLDLALDFLSRRSFGRKTKKTVILSDILESGYNTKTLYAKVAKSLESRGVDKLICIGDKIKELAKHYTGDVVFYDSGQEFLDSEDVRLRNEVVLIKGARKFHFEEISERLEKKINETILEINLDAIVANLNHYREMLKPGVKTVCMVKASAYGSGAHEVAKTLQDQHVDYLAVAVADEGVELRKAGISLPIMIMDPEVSSFHALFKYGLEPEIYDFTILNSLINAAQKEGITNFPIHLKIDTGMHRLGFQEFEIDDLIRILQGQYALIPKSVFSHFAGSDDRNLDYFTQHQGELFLRLSAKIQSHFAHPILRHICNTAGIEYQPKYHLDMVRLGLGLYGINPMNNKIINNVSALKTTILQIKELSHEETVGYGRCGVLLGDHTMIAVIPIGYADGLNRRLGNRAAYCLVNGQKAPYVGNICMDVCMIDVTGIRCKVGDTVEIFGDNLPITTLSDILGTIPYEILTTISTRVKRVYYHD